jgi:hypothetical protein
VIQIVPNKSGSERGLKGHPGGKTASLNAAVLDRLMPGRAMQNVLALPLNALSGRPL